MSRPDTLVLAGALAQRPNHGGHTWVFLQYLLGLRRLGWDVLFVDWLHPDMCGTEAGVETSVNLRYLRDVFERFGLGDAYAVTDVSTGTSYGVARREVIERIRHSAALVNFMGYLDDEDLLGAAPVRVFLDIDPGFGQMWRALGLADPFAGHDLFVTVGENIGAPECSIPTCGLDWITTPQPVVLDEWPVVEDRGEAFTSVAAWRGPYGPIEYEGRTYGLRVHEFRRFVELPRISGHTFELALDIDSAESGDLELLRANGWHLADPVTVAADPWSYRDYIQGSLAELMVAKNMYVQARTGWFSDRSICYLASGRPVLAQDTGLAGRFGERDGLVLFSTLDEAREGAGRIASDPILHGRAARSIAEDHFGSDQVLSRLLARLRVG